MPFNSATILFINEPKAKRGYLPALPFERATAKK